MSLHSGTTNITAWQQFDDSSVFVQVDFPSGTFDGTPNIAASLDCDTRVQPPTTGIRVMNPSPVGFMAYLQLASGEPLTTDEAQSFNWRVSYIASSD